MPPIVIDSREQRPYEFASSIFKGLPTGDYSILGFEDRIAIERKSMTDAYGCLGRRRARFRRECERLGKLDYAAIVVEASLPGFLHRPHFSQLNPRAAIGLLLEWSVRYDVAVLFAGDRDHARALTLKLLTAYWKHRREARNEHAQP